MTMNALFELPLLLAALTSFFLVSIVFPRRGSPGAPALLIMLLAAGFWAGMYALELRMPTLDAKLLAAKLQYLGIVALVPAWFVFTVQFTRQDRWIATTSTGRLVLSIIPALTLILVWTNELHGLIWTSAIIDTSTPIDALVLRHGAGFWLLIGYDYLLVLVGTVWLLGVAMRSSGTFHRQALALLIGILPVWLANALYVMQWGLGAWLDLTPFAMTITGAVYAWSLLHLHLLDIVPLARSELFAVIEDAIVVVDLSSRIVDVNPAGQQLALNPEQTLVGKPLAALLGTQAGLVIPAALANHATLGDICVLRAGEARTFELRASPLRDVDSHLEGCLCVLHDITQRKQAEEALQLLAQNLEQRVLERTRELHILGHHLESIREDEQSRIAREIHDELGQALTVLKLNVSWLSRHVQNNGDAVPRRLAAMNDLLGASIETVQRIAAELRPAMLDHLGLVAALEWLTRTYEERTGIVCTFVHSGDDTVLMDKDLATALFRISQEALTNTARHANARSVDLCLEVTEGEILLEIKDDGIGIKQAQVDDPRAFGIIGMRERLYPWQGHMTMTGAHGQGTTISIVIPWPAAPREAL